MSNARDKANIPALNFSSTGIDDNATSTAITINSSEQVGIGTASPSLGKLTVSGSGDQTLVVESTDSDSQIRLRIVGEGDVYVRNRDGDLTFENTSEAMRINSSGSVGIGTSSPSSSWSNANNFVISDTSSDGGMTILTGTSGTGNLIFADGTGGGDNTRGGIQYFHSSNEMKFRVNNDAKLLIDSSGNVGIGTSSLGTYKLSVDSGTAGTTNAEAGIFSQGQRNGVVYNFVTNNTSVAAGRGTGIKYQSGGFNLGAIITRSDATAASGDAPGYMTFHTSSDNTEDLAERMRIGSTGQFTLTGNVNSTLVEAYNDHASDPYGYNIDFRNASPDDNSNYFLNCKDSTTNRARIESDGDLQNHDNSYGSISDERIKQDIRDSNSQWNDIKNIRVRNFKKKDDVRQYGENAWEQIGVIAQELETVSPKLIKHSDPEPSDILSNASFGTLYEEGDEIPEDKKVGDVKEVHEQVKSVSYSVLYMKSIKALQEAMERIETLEAKVQTLENNNP